DPRERRGLQLRELDRSEERRQHEQEGGDGDRPARRPPPGPPARRLRPGPAGVPGSLGLARLSGLTGLRGLFTLRGFFGPRGVFSLRRVLAFHPLHAAFSGQYVLPWSGPPAAHATFQSTWSRGAAVQTLPAFLPQGPPPPRASPVRGLSCGAVSHS